MSESCASNDRIAEGHPPALPKCHCLLEYSLRDGKNTSDLKEVDEVLPMLLVQAVIPQHFHLTDG